MRASYPEQKPNVEDLVSSNLELVKKIAWHIYGRVHASVEIEDLIQTGCIRLPAGFKPRLFSKKTGVHKFLSEFMS